MSDMSRNCESIHLTSCPEFYAGEPPKIPIAKRVHGVLVEETIVSIAVSNATHYEVQKLHSMFLFVHARHLAQRCTAYFLGIAPSRGVTNIELHVEDCTRVSVQKRVVQRDCDSRGPEHDLNLYEEIDVLKLDKPVPTNWKRSVIQNRKLKYQWGSALAAVTTIRCAEYLIKTKNEEVEINVYGAFLQFSPRIERMGINDTENLKVKVLSNGCAFIRYIVEDEDEISHLTESQGRKICWTLKFSDESVDLTTPKETFRECSVSVLHYTDKYCEHREAETRMQYTLSKELRKRTIGSHLINILQVSQYTDNVCLAMFAMYFHSLRGANTVFVRIGQTNFNIGLLLRAITEAGLDVASVGCLYSLSGNEFQIFCAVASGKAMFRFIAHYIMSSGICRRFTVV